MTFHKKFFFSKKVCQIKNFFIHYLQWRLGQKRLKMNPTTIIKEEGL